MLRYFIVYPKGDESKLTVAQDEGYKRDEWALASKKEFDELNDAIAYARALAAQYDKQYVPSGIGGHNFLDEGEDEDSD